MTEHDVEMTGALRGAPWPGSHGVAYPRADPTDFDRLPIDTWTMAGVPAGVRIELDLGPDVEAVLVDYETLTDDPGFRGEGAGVTFALWTGAGPVCTEPARLGKQTVVLEAPAGGGSVVIYLPEGMRPRVSGLRTIGGTATAADRGPAWLCYGDSIAEGWSASEPGLSWPMLVARAHGLDVTNLGYAGAARGEIVSAFHVASLPADVISLSHGTNCWNRTPHSSAQVAADYDAFLEIVRRGHPTAPIVVLSPLTRPDAETTTNLLGATLEELRGAIEEVVESRQIADPNLVLAPGRDMIGAHDLVDGVHPGNAGHERIAAAMGPLLSEAVGRC